MVRTLVVAGVLAAAASTAHADRDLCARGTQHHGATIDLDLKAADLHDVLRLLSDVGHVNLVVGDDVDGKVTLKLKNVAWDAAACTVAAVHHLSIDVQDNILLVRKRDAK